MKGIPKSEFFLFFRQRLGNLKQIEALRPSFSLRPYASFNPEVNILAGVELDALAKYWGIKTRGPASSATRLGEFLSTHADSAIWAKCSHVDLLRRATEEAAVAAGGQKKRDRRDLSDPARQSHVLESTLRRILAPEAFVPYTVLRWTVDPTLDVLLGQSDIQAAGIPLDWLRRSRYGEILYRHYRSAWVHALDPDAQLEAEHVVRTGPEPEPHYFAFNGEARLSIPTEFILRSLEMAVTSFEQQVPDDTVVTLRP